MPIGVVTPITKCCSAFMAPPGQTRRSLKAYLHRLEEAEKRDHRKIGKSLDLFHTQEEAPGMVFWHDKGWSIYQPSMVIFADLAHNGIPRCIHHRSSIVACGRSPVTGTSSAMTCLPRHAEHRDYAVKPMNCPCHMSDL